MALSPIVADAVSALINFDPFHSARLMSVSLIEEEDKKKMPTAATDCYKKVWVNPKFLETMGPKARAAVIAHEVQHIVRMHGHARTADYLNSDDGFRPDLWNYATDFIINADLYRMGYPMSEVTGGKDVKLQDLLAFLEGTGPEVRGFMFDLSITQRDDANAIYEKLVEAEQKNPNPPKRQEMTVGGGSDGQGEGEDGQGEGTQSGVHTGSDILYDEFDKTCNEEGVTPEQAQNDIASSNSAALESAKSRGNAPGYAEQIVSEFNKHSVDWRPILRRFVRGTTRDDFSYRRVSRRSVGDGSGIVRPGMFSERPGHIVMIVDESASVSDKELQQGLGEMQSILKRVKPERITIVTCDTRVTGVTTFKPGDKLHVKCSGRGGTDMNPAFEWVASLNRQPECVVCFTDGELVYPPKQRVPTIWAICNPYRRPTTADWGTQVEITVND